MKESNEIHIYNVIFSLDLRYKMRCHVREVAFGGERVARRSGFGDWHPRDDLKRTDLLSSAPLPSHKTSRDDPELARVRELEGFQKGKKKTKK